MGWGQGMGIISSVHSFMHIIFYTCILVSYPCGIVMAGCWHFGQDSSLLCRTDSLSITLGNIDILMKIVLVQLCNLPQSKYLSRTYYPVSLTFVSKLIPFITCEWLIF